MLSSLLLFSAFGAAFGSNTWSYDRCSPIAPNRWPGICSQQDALEQTPIDLCGAKPFPGEVPKMNGTGYDVPRQAAIFNNGHTVQINIKSSPTPVLDFGSLSSIVGRAPANATANQWKLAQVHFHWGREGKDDEGSEHFMQGKKYPLEAHFVHFNADYADIGSAVAGAGTRALLVAGYFFELGDSEPALITSVAAEAPTARQTAMNMTDLVKLSDVIDLKGDFYSYGGGLTTPMCNMIVTWAVFSTPKKITAASLARFKKVSSEPATMTTSQKFHLQNTGEGGPIVPAIPISRFGNFRPLQPIGTRTVYYTKGSTEACTGVAADSSFTCITSAAAAAHPGAALGLLLAVALTLLLRA